MIAEIPLGEWLPDGADYKNPGLTVCDGCYPSSGGYGPFRKQFGSGLSVTGEVRGAARFLRASGQVVVVVGTTTDLFTIVGGVVTANSLGLSLPENVFWSFERFGDQVWAFAYNQTPRYIADIEVGVAFADHPGIAPKAANCNRVGDFLVTSNMVDIDASVQPYRVRWSKFNNPAGDYGTDLATESGFVDMPQQYGPVLGVFGGRYNVVLQKYGVSRIAYTGGATVFAKDVIEEQSGCVSAPSVVTVGQSIYYLGSSGFMVSDGTSVASISAGRVYEWFLENSDEASREKVQGAVDWNERAIVWSFVPKNGATISRQIIYSWEHNRWSTASLEVDWLFETNEAGLSLEQVAALYPDLDAMPVSLDSPQFKARERSLASIVGGEFGLMTGDAVTATWETGEFQPKAGHRACTSEVYPLIENQDTNARLAIGARPVTKGGPVSWTPEKAVGPGGFAPIHKDGRYLRARMSVPSGSVWDKAVGLQVKFTATGAQ